MSARALPLLLLLAASYPPGSNVVNVVDHGANGADQLDDTAAFQSAASASAHYGHVMYVPNGTYLLSDTVRAQILHGASPTLKWSNSWLIECESRQGTILRLIDNAPGYQDPAAAKAMLAWGSTQANAPQTGTGGGVEAYRNSMQDCTVDIGAGNAGARALDWVCSNRGALRNLTIRSSDPARAGAAGIWAGRAFPGPCLIEDVEVVGFDRGIWDGQVQYGFVYRDIELRGQRVYGIDATADVVTIEGLRSRNSVPVIRSESGSGQLVLIDADLTGGDPGKVALNLGGTSQAFLRDVRSVGYQALLKRGSSVKTELGHAVREWVSHAPMTIHEDAGELESLRLPAPRPPEPFESNDWANDWADVRAYGANPLDQLDDLAGVQAALNSGKPIVYLPQGVAGGAGAGAYRFSDTLEVPCTVRRIRWMEGIPVSMPDWPASHPLMRFAAGCSPADATVVEGIWSKPTLDGGYHVEHGDRRALYVRDAQIAFGQRGIWAKPGSGPLFVANVVLRTLRIDGPHSVWAWQLNPESLSATDGVENNGGTLRIVGMKTEGVAADGSATLTARARSRTELLGGMMMPCVGLGSVRPQLGFVLEDVDAAALVYTNWCGKAADLATWETQVREARLGQVGQIGAAELPAYAVQGGNKVFVPLFVSRP